MKHFLAFVWEIFEIVVIAVVTVFIIRTFLIQPFLVRGASMEPNFLNGNYLLVDEMTYRFRSPERGEVIVFRYPGDPSTYYIKRIIGLPEEALIINDGKIKIINTAHPEGFWLEESYLVPGLKTSGDEKITLGLNQYFVLGDNRMFSFDSRSWGVLDGKNIIGIVRVRLWPLKEADLFNAPAYPVVEL